MPTEQQALMPCQEQLCTIRRALHRKCALHRERGMGVCITHLRLTSGQASRRGVYMISIPLGTNIMQTPRRRDAWSLTPTLSCFLPTIACSNAMHVLMQLVIHNKLDYMYDQYSICHDCSQVKSLSMSGEDGPPNRSVHFGWIVARHWMSHCSNIPCGWIHLVVATLWLEQCSGPQREFI